MKKYSFLEKKYFRPRFLQLRLFVLISALEVLALITLFSDISLTRNNLYFATLILTVSVFVACLAIVMKLISILREIEELYQLQGEQNNVILREVRDGVIVCDDKGTILKASTFLFETLHYTEEFLKGKVFSAYLAPQTGVEGFWKQLKERKRTGVKMTARRKDGVELPCEAHVVSVMEKKELKGFYGFVQFPQEKRIWDVVKKDMLASLYEEIRDDVETLSVAASALPREISERIGNIANEIAGRAMPDFADRMRASYRPEPYELQAILEQLKKWAEPLARLRGINLIMKNEENVTFVGDRDKVYRALKNVLANALKYTQCEGNVSVGTDLTEGGFLITISDNGPGIPNQDQSFLSQPFFKSAQPGREKNLGLGMGLWLASEFIKLHRGRMEIESQQGKGTKVTVLIPRKRTE
ncbi:MAG: PAS domain S-box protein [Endomicrobiales bacterium]|nr:PAS domain S-box protein [Endomicrobiales bacterium]